MKASKGKNMLSRRSFLKASGLAGTGFAISVIFSSRTEASDSPVTEALEDELGISIDEEGKVTIRVYPQEMGQGATTGIAMITAEELDADWSQVVVEQVGLDRSFATDGEYYGRQDTGGSTSIEGEWMPMREAGAKTRLMLIQAAASFWGVSVDECDTEPGVVVCPGKDKRLGFGEIAVAAGKLPVPPQATFRNPDDYRIVGRPLPNRITQSAVRGRTIYSADVKLPDMEYAMIVRPPVRGGRLRRFEAREALAMPGVRSVFVLDPIDRDEEFCKGIRGGLVIVGDSTWTCMQARQALQVEWDDGPNGQRSSDELFEEFGHIHEEAETSRERPSTPSFKTLVADYESPYLAHGLMEPLNATAHCKPDGRVEIWIGSQSPHYTASNIAEILKVDRSLITLHPHAMGGGFGRRFFTDFALEAAIVSKKRNKPVKLVWTREDEVQFSFYHPLRKDYYRCELDDAGNILSLERNAYTTHPWGGFQGSDFCYWHRNVSSYSYFHEEKLLQCGSWRSVMPHLDHFSQEIFIDELAHAVGKDPLDYRLELLTTPFPKELFEPEQSSQLERLEYIQPILTRLHEEMRSFCDWSRPRPEGVGLGIAAGIYHSSIIVQVAEVEMLDGKPRVSKFYCVADCGLAINPNLVRGQIEGAILWAMAPVLYGGIDVTQGRVVQSSFHNMPIPKIGDSPEIDIKLINPTDRSPQGVGEFAVLPVAPAIYNALHKVSGKRIRSLRVPLDQVMQL